LYGPSDTGCLALFPGDCAPDQFFYGKWFGEYDFKFLKKFNLPHKAVFETSIEIFNALQGINFNNTLNPQGTPPNGASTNFQVTSQGSAARTGQLVWRISW